MPSRYWAVSVSEPTARIGLRESLFLRPREAPAIASRLKSLGLVDSVLLSSCARFELFSGSGADGLVSALRWFDERAGKALDGPIQIFKGTEALRHAFRLSSGLDSRIPGDSRVTELVREAYRRACALGMAGPMTHRVFQRALHVRTRIRQQARITSRFGCFAEAAVEFLLRLSEGKAGEKLIVFGAGRLAEDAALRLGALGLPGVLVCGRRAERTRALAALAGARAAGIEEGLSALPKARAALFACAADKPVLVPFEALHARRGAPLTLIDAGLPRNVDPRMRKSPGVRLYDLDDIYRLVKGLLGTRPEGTRKAEGIISAEIESFLKGSGREELV